MKQIRIIFRKEKVNLTENDLYHYHISVFMEGKMLKELKAKRNYRKTWNFTSNG